MSALAIGLVLLAAAVHATWNLRLHRAEDRVAVIAVAGIVSGAMLFPFVLVDPPVEVVGWIAVSTAAEIVYGLSLAAAYRRGDLSLTYPVGRGLAPVLATIGAWVALGERPPAIALLGAVCMAVGLALLGWEARRARSLEAFAFALLVAVTVAIYSVVDADAVTMTGPLGYLAFPLFLSGVAEGAMIRFDRSRLRAAIRPGFVVGLGSCVAYGLVLFAFRLSPVGPVTTLREVSVLIAVGLAAERVTLRRWVGVGACLVGAILAAVS
jgi:drug/metabolite transporter (DMT)-like permease